LKQAAALAERLRREAGDDPAKQAARAFELLFQRPAAAEEIAEASRLITAQGLPAFCRALYNANEFVRIE
jgi:hypothetical protein